MYTGESSYLHKMNAAMYAGCAALSAQLAEEEKARVYLRRAKAAAKMFDAEPAYGAERVRFYHGRWATAHDDFGETAMEGIAQTIARQEAPVRAVLESLWEQVKAE